ncbi:hypothetical protein Tco_0527774 [Tanacetum coccineum]
MLAPSGGGLILYQTYGNLYAMIGRKAYLLEDKQIPSVGVFDEKSYDDRIIHVEEPEFKVADSDMPQDQEENQGKDDEEPKRKVSSKRDWSTKPKQPEDPTDPDWNVGKTPQQGPTQSWLMTLASSADKPSKTFDELMSTPIDFSAYIMNGLKITNLTQETLLGPVFKLLKGTCTNYAELEYDLIGTNRKAAVTRVEVMRKHRYGYLREIEVRRANNDLYTFKEGDFSRLRINDNCSPEAMFSQKRESRICLFFPKPVNQNYQKKINGQPILKLQDAASSKKGLITSPKQDPQGFIYVDTQGRNMLMRSDELYKFSDGTLTRLRTLLDDITKNI